MHLPPFNNHVGIGWNPFTLFLIVMGFIALVIWLWKFRQKIKQQQLLERNAPDVFQSKPRRINPNEEIDRDVPVQTRHEGGTRVKSFASLAK